MPSKFIVNIYLGIVSNYATWLGHKSSCWNYFDETIELTGSIECVIAILKFFYKVFFYSVLKKDQVMKGAVKKLKAFQLTRTFMFHLLNMTDCVKQTPETFEIAHFWVKSWTHGTFSSRKANKRIETLKHFAKLNRLWITSKSYEK